MLLTRLIHALSTVTQLTEFQDILHENYVTTVFLNQN